MNQPYAPEPPEAMPFSSSMAELADGYRREAARYRRRLIDMSYDVLADLLADDERQGGFAESRAGEDQEPEDMELPIWVTRTRVALPADGAEEFREAYVFLLVPLSHVAGEATEHLRVHIPTDALVPEGDAAAEEVVVEYIDPSGSAAFYVVTEEKLEQFEPQARRGAEVRDLDLDDSQVHLETLSHRISPRDKATARLYQLFADSIPMPQKKINLKTGEIKNWQ